MSDTVVPGGPEFGVPIRTTGRFSAVHSLFGPGGSVGVDVGGGRRVGGGVGGRVIMLLGGCGSGRAKMMLEIPPPIAIGGGVGRTRIGIPIPNRTGGRVGGRVMSAIGGRYIGRKSMTLWNTGIVHSTCSRYDPLRVE